jgi:peptidoglycan hydrolase-like protein with peptidoglycan-binding domain
VITHEVPIVQRERYRRHDVVTRRPVAPAAILALGMAAIAVFGMDAMMGGGSSGSGEVQSITPTVTEAPADQSGLAAAAAPVSTAAQLAVDTEGCQLTEGDVQVGDTGTNVECVQKALTVSGHYTGAIDGTFSQPLAAAAIAFQTQHNLYVDGIVGRRTAEQLGIWPGDDSFVVRTPAPAPGAVDLMGYELSSVASAGSDAPPLPDNAGQDTGRRIVYSRLAQRVWAIDDDERTVRSYLVTGSQYNNEVPGTHEVYSKSDRLPPDPDPQVRRFGVQDRGRARPAPLRRLPAPGPSRRGVHVELRRDRHHRHRALDRSRPCVRVTPE